MKVKYGDMTVNTREVYVNTRDSIIVHDRAHTYFFCVFFFPIALYAKMWSKSYLEKISCHLQIQWRRVFDLESKTKLIRPKSFKNNCVWSPAHDIHFNYTLTEFVQVK